MISPSVFIDLFVCREFITVNVCRIQLRSLITQDVYMQPTKGKRFATLCDPSALYCQKSSEHTNILCLGSNMGSYSTLMPCSWGNICTQFQLLKPSYQRKLCFMQIAEYTLYVHSKCIVAIRPIIPLKYMSSLLDKENIDGQFCKTKYSTWHFDWGMLTEVFFRVSPLSMVLNKQLVFTANLCSNYNINQCSSAEDFFTFHINWLLILVYY